MLNIRILVVDDHGTLRKRIADYLRAQEGVEEVAEAANGVEALKCLRESRFDVMITDLVMPLMDGPTMVRHVRERYPDLPILFMSGYAEEQLRKSIDLDNVAFLAKPFSVQQLAEAARDVLAAK